MNLKKSLRNINIINPTLLTTDDVVSQAQYLLGKIVRTELNHQVTSLMITETEAYRGHDDKASHAYDYRRTSRTEVMFGPSGRAYVYLCYGIHHLFNVVVGPKEVPNAILIRAGQPIEGLSTMMSRRNMKKLKPNLSAGPALFSQALNIKTEHTGTNLFAENSPIRLFDAGFNFSPEEIIASPRVGIDYAEECISWPWRFRIKDSIWTSPAK